MPAYLRCLSAHSNVTNHLPGRPWNLLSGNGIFSRFKWKNNCNRLLMLMLACLLLYPASEVYSQALARPYYLETRESIFEGRQFRLRDVRSGKAGEWRFIGVFGNAMTPLFEGGPPELKELYKPVSIWYPAFLGSSVIALTVTTWNIVEPSFDWNIAYVAATVAVFSFFLTENSMNKTKSLYNEWVTEQHYLGLQWKEDHLVVQFRQPLL